MEILYAFLMVIYSLHIITSNVIASTVDHIPGMLHIRDRRQIMTNIPSMHMNMKTYINVNNKRGEDISSLPSGVERSQLRRDEELGNELLRRTLRSAYLKVHARLAEKRRRDILDYLYQRNSKISRSSRALTEDVNYQLIMPHIHHRHNIVSNHTIRSIARSSIIRNNVNLINSQASLSSSTYKNMTSLLLNTTLAKRNDITKHNKYNIASDVTISQTTCCNEGYEGKCCPKNHFGHNTSINQPSLFDGCCGNGLAAVCCPNQNTLQREAQEGNYGNYPSCCGKAIINTCCGEHKRIGTTVSSKRRNKKDETCKGKSSDCVSSRFDEKTTYESPCSIMARKLFDLPYTTEYPLCNERNQTLINQSYKKRHSKNVFPTQSRINAKPINKPSNRKVVISPRPPLAPPLLEFKKKGMTQQKTTKKRKEDLRYRLKVRAVNSNNKPKKHIKIKYKNRVIRLKLVKKKKGKIDPTKNEITLKIKKRNDVQTSPLVRVKRDFDDQSEDQNSGPRDLKTNSNSTESKNENAKSHKLNPLFNINPHDSDLMTALTLRNNIDKKLAGMRKQSAPKKHTRNFIRPMKTTKSAHARHHHIHRNKRSKFNVKTKGKSKTKRIVVTVRRQNNEILLKDQ